MSDKRLILVAVLAAALARPGPGAAQVPACTVRELPAFGELASRQAALDSGGILFPNMNARTNVPIRIVHRRAKNATAAPPAWLSEPDSAAYRARYSGEDAVHNAILDALTYNDLTALRSAVEKAIPDPAQRRRETFLKFHVDPLFYAFGSGSRPIVEQLLQWDPDALNRLDPRWRDDHLGAVLGHWHRAAQADLDDHEDDDPRPPPDRRIAEDHAWLVDQLLRAGAVPRESTLGTPSSGFANLAALPPSPETLRIAAEFQRRGAPIGATDLGSSPFVAAARMGNVELVQQIMRNQHPSQALLDEAILVTPMAQDNPLVKLLLDAGADVSARSQAVRNLQTGHVDLARRAAERYRDFHDDVPIRLLIEHHVDPNQTPAGRANYSALILLLGEPSLAMALLDLGADPNWHDSEGNTPLHLVTRTMRSAQALALDPQDRARLVAALLAHGADPNALNAFGATPLRQLSADETPSIELLFKAGAQLRLQEKDLLYRAFDPSTKNSTELKFGPVVWATLQGNDALASGVLARQDRLDADDCAAVYFAARSGAPGTLTALLDRGAETHLVSTDTGLTPLMAAATQGQLASVRILLDRGVAKVDEATSRTWLAPKDVAANMFYYGVFVTSVGGETALMQAAREAHVEIVSELLRHGADVNRKNASGQSALGYARTGRSHVGDRAAQTERLLLEHGARE